MCPTRAGASMQSPAPPRLPSQSKAGTCNAMQSTTSGVATCQLSVSSARSTPCGVIRTTNNATACKTTILAIARGVSFIALDAPAATAFAQCGKDAEAFPRTPESRRTSSSSPGWRRRIWRADAWGSRLCVSMPISGRGRASAPVVIAGGSSSADAVIMQSIVRKHCTSMCATDACVLVD
eukprot:2170094-Prymnesium_polylepis.1